MTNLSLFHFGSTVQSEVTVAMVVQECFQNVQHFGHLSKYQYPVVS